MRGSDLALIEECPGRADLDAFSAAGASGRAPRLSQIRNYVGIDAASHDVPDMRAFDFAADSHATCAEDAAIGIGGEALVRGIHFQLRIPIGKPNVSESLIDSHGLQFAMAVGHADCTDVVAFGEEQLQDRAAMLLEPLGAGGYFHPLFNLSDAGRQQLVVALNLNQAETACAYIGESVQMAECRDVDAIFLRDFQNGLVGAGAYIVSVNDECFYIYGYAHAVTSTAAPHEHTPAEQCFFSMCSMYSCLK